MGILVPSARAARRSASVNFFNGVNTRWTYGIDAAGQFYVTVDPAKEVAWAQLSGSRHCDPT